MAVTWTRLDSYGSALIPLAYVCVLYVRQLLAVLDWLTVLACNPVGLDSSLPTPEGRANNSRCINTAHSKGMKQASKKLTESGLFLLLKVMFRFASATT